MWLMNERYHSVRLDDNKSTNSHEGAEIETRISMNMTHGASNYTTDIPI
jgi:hypothetical protein